MQRTLIVLGAALILVGIAWPWLGRLGLGRLPGDLRIETANGRLYIPIATCVLASVALSLLAWLLRR